MQVWFTWARRGWGAAAAAAVAGCASFGPAEGDHGGPSVEELASALVDELAYLRPGDPDLERAQAHLDRIAAVAIALRTAPRAAPAPLVEPLGVSEPRDLVGRLSPLPEILAPASFSDPPSAEVFGLNLGVFADAALGQTLWAELQAIEALALSGLAPSPQAVEGGIVLLAGALPDRASAEARCAMLAAWGVACQAHRLEPVE